MTTAAQNNTRKNAAKAMRQAWEIAKAAAAETGKKASLFFREALRQAWAEIKAAKKTTTVSANSINAFLKNKNNLHILQWVLLGIAKGDMKNVKSFETLERSDRNYISLIKGQIMDSARAAGITATGAELASLVAEKVKTKQAEKAEMKATLAETLFDAPTTVSF